MRNVSAHAGKSARRVVTALMSAAFAQDTADAAKGQWRKVADQVRPSLPKLAGLLDEAETDVLAYMTFPPAHRAKLHSTDVIDERLVERAVISSRRADDLVAKSGARLQAPSGRLQVLLV